MRVIYKATCLTNSKSYIGKDSNWPSRVKAHKCYALTQDSNDVFHRAIRKYGWENFKWEILEIVGDDDLDKLEQHHIKEHNTFYLTGHGYNMTLGGEGHRGSKHLNRLWKIIDPEGRVSCIKGLKDYCRKKGWFYEAANQYARNGAPFQDHFIIKVDQEDFELPEWWTPDFKEQRRSTWKENNKQSCKESLKKRPIRWHLQNEDGRIYLTNNLKKLCRDRFVNYDAMSHLVQRDGWTCKKLDNFKDIS